VIQKGLTIFFLNFAVLIFLALSVYATVKDQKVESVSNDSVIMLLFSIGLIGTGYLMRRYLRG
jgi:hypothetical protein